MATYVNDLRLKEIATGDESGTWGTSTNTNLELIAEAFSFGTEAITTNADTHTTTIADGSTDPGRSIFLQYTGTLDSTCTITIGPNTVSKLWFIENATSGSQSIIISQGSGANITIPNGQTKAVYSDGAGSGAAIVDALVDLDLTGTTTVAALTASGVITGATVEATGDTSSGDNAAMGFTSAEGLILTGQGSTNDVTIKNDADTAVLQVPTGTTNATIAGTLGVAGDATNGVVISQGDIAIKNGGTQSTIKFYCESSNAHYAQIQAPAHSAFSGNVTLTLPAATDTLAGIAATQTLTNKTLTTPTLTTPIANAGLQLKNGATSAGFIEFFEDSDNGTNKVTLIGPASTADITLTLPSSDGDSGQVLTTDGAGVLSFATVSGAYNSWLVKTSAYTALAGDQIIVNSSSAVTITLPASASAGNTVTIKATGGGTVTVGRNSQNINSTASDGTLASGSATQLVFVDSTIGFLEI